MHHTILITWYHVHTLSLCLILAAHMGTRQAMGLRSYHYAVVSIPVELSVALHWHRRSNPSSGAHSSLPPFLLLFFCSLANSVQGCGNFILGSAYPSVQCYKIGHRAFRNQLFLPSASSPPFVSTEIQGRSSRPALCGAVSCRNHITNCLLIIFGSWISYVFFLIHPNSRLLTSSPAHPFHKPWTLSYT